MSDNPNQTSVIRKVSNHPKKPYPDFPLGPSTNGYWQKRINSKLHYFGRWRRVISGKLGHLFGDGWKEGLELYKSQADDLHAGRTPRAIPSDSLTVHQIRNAYLTHQERKLESDKITQRTFSDC